MLRLLDPKGKSDEGAFFWQACVPMLYVAFILSAWPPTVISLFRGIVALYSDGFLDIPEDIYVPLVTLIFAYVNIVVSIRRLHDVGRSGWYALTGQIPILGIGMYFYLLLTPGVKEPGTNMSSTFRRHIS